MIGILALLHRQSSGLSLGSWLARVVVRGAVYRVLWWLPLPVVVVVAGLALVLLARSRGPRGRA